MLQSSDFTFLIDTVEYVLSYPRFYDFNIWMNVAAGDMEKVEVV